MSDAPTEKCACGQCRQELTAEFWRINVSNGFLDHAPAWLGGCTPNFKDMTIFDWLKGIIRDEKMAARYDFGFEDNLHQRIRRRGIAVNRLKALKRVMTAAEMLNLTGSQEVMIDIHESEGVFPHPKEKIDEPR